MHYANVEKKYGDKLPVFRGSAGTYWEDGAGSSALETGMNRQSSDRLVQAESLYAMLNPQAFPAADFENAWSLVLLYSEHTWGAWCSIGGPERKETLEQWQIKQSYALDADKQSKTLLNQSLTVAAAQTPEAGAIEVFNTTSWPRTEIVRLAAGLSRPGDRVVDHKGGVVPSQRLSTGELAFLARVAGPDVVGAEPGLGSVGTAAGRIAVDVFPALDSPAGLEAPGQERRAAIHVGFPLFR